VVEATYAYLVPVSLSYGFMGVSMVVGSTFLALGRPLPSLLLTITRMLVLYLPLACLGDHLWGYRGIFYATALCTVVVSGMGHLWLRSVLPARPAPAVRLGQN
jgi:Na+-driven multidrug efflux pump